MLRIVLASFPSPVSLLVLALAALFSPDLWGLPWGLGRECASRSTPVSLLDTAFLLFSPLLFGPLSERFRPVLRG